MMNFGTWGNGYYGMTSGLGTIMAIIWWVILIDLILLGVWLWKKINNNK